MVNTAASVGKRQMAIVLNPLFLAYGWEQWEDFDSLLGRFRNIEYVAQLGTLALSLEEDLAMHQESEWILR